MRKFARRAVLLKSFVFALAVVLNNVTISVTQASLITFNFQGEITTVGAESPFFGAYTFDSTTPNSGVVPLGIYQNTLTSIAIDVDGYQISGPTVEPGYPASQITVVNDVGLNSEDQYSVFSGVNGAPLSGFAPFRIDISLSGAVGVFNDRSLPLMLPDLARFTSRTFDVQFHGPGGQLVVLDGIITSLAPVPEPHVIALLAFGLVGLWLRRGIGPFVTLRRYR